VPKVGKNGPPQKLVPGPPLPPPEPARPTLPASACAKERFAAVYRAEAPSEKMVYDALTALNACRDAGLISKDEYSRIQVALLAK
jgi:hypothetical protein